MSNPPFPSPRPWCAEAETAARAHFDTRAKPPGSLGKIEHVAAWWCGTTGRFPPMAPARPRAYVFAADHGVAADHRPGAALSRYPQSATARRVSECLLGGAAIHHCCVHYGVDLTIVDVGVLPGVHEQASSSGSARFLSRPIRPGTGDFRAGLAMSRAEAEAAVQVGIACAQEAANDDVDVLCAGEIGVGNTTCAAAVLAAIAAVPGKLSVGRGSGVDDAGIARKVGAVDAGIALHRPARDDGIGVLSAVGGLEIAAIAGLCIGGAAFGVPVLIDGFACTAGGLVASVLAPDCVQHLLISHRSAENGHWAMSRYLRREPVHDLDLCLGEGTGAVMAVDTIRLAVRLLNGMAAGA
ncbi:MAG: nicotinate-nucleotide--dimethylbenzimidazole phosphoribosyltransferase [Myxococcales bacterium]|nr:nicotinate-nucleotide--dimethylbenzimidazole phosphoribosyltransferase [Myxococcales bacterium]